LANRGAAGAGGPCNRQLGIGPQAYSHDANAAANLLAAHNFTAEAEQAYGVASQLYPGNPEPVNGLADLLVKNGQQDQARQLLQDFARRYPDQQKFLERSPTWMLLIGNK
jgi:hypothetical protein